MGPLNKAEAIRKSQFIQMMTNNNKNKNKLLYNTDAGMHTSPNMSEAITHNVMN